MRAKPNALHGFFLTAAAMTCASAQEQAVRGERIEVTGSNIKRIEAETALPVTVISRDEIRRSGATTAAELMEKISANVGGFTVAMGQGDSTTPGLASASLRGLGTNSTLVLMNGRRLSTFAFTGVGRSATNLNQIPLAAVERVEVLKDGASAIYGTDAIAGVINFILRSDYRGGDVSAYGSSTQGGGGQTHRYTGSFGIGDLARDRYNAIVTLDYQKDAALKASQRPEFAVTAIRPDLGVARTSGNVDPANFFFDGVQYNTTAAGNCRPEIGAYRIVTASGAPSTTALTCRYDFTSVLDILPPAERAGFFARGVWKFAADHQAFVEYHRGRSDITYASSETPVLDFTGNGPFLYPSGGPFYPSSFVATNGRIITPTGDLQLAWRLRAGGLRTNQTETDEDRLVAGAQGAIAGWDYNGAFTRATSTARENYLDGWVRESLLRPAIASGRIDVFSGSAATPEAQRLIDATKIIGKVRESEASVTSFDARASREIFETKHGVAALALGVERRKEALEERPEQVLYSGDIQSGGGALPAITRATRTVDSAFGELALPLAAGLEAQIATRMDRFSDFGRSVNPKVALRWTPRPEILLRASAGRGFRAPSLGELFLPHERGLAFEIDPARCPGGTPLGAFVTEPCNESLFEYGGNIAAQPERSRQWSAGLVLEPSPGTSLAFDYWSIRRSTTLDSLAPEAIFRDIASRDPVSAGGHFVRRPRVPGGGCEGDEAVPTPADVPCALAYTVGIIENLGERDTRGLDVSVSTRAQLAGWGTIMFRIEGTYYMRYRLQLEPDGDFQSGLGLVSPVGVISRWRHYAQLTWRREAWEATLAHNFILGYTDEEAPPAPPRRVGPWESWDALAMWRAWRGFEVTAGVRNLFNRAPPASRQSSTFQVGYDARYYDPRGRTYHLALRYAF